MSTDPHSGSLYLASKSACHQCDEILGSHRVAEVITLPLGTVFRLQKGELVFGFCSLGHDTVLQTIAHRNDGTDDGIFCIVRGIIQILHE